MIKKIGRLIVDGISATGEFVLYVSQMLLFDTFKNHVKKEKRDKKLIVLANGPSLKQSFTEIIDSRMYLENDLITVNFMVNDDRFFTIKPRYHVISDYTLFHNSQGNEEKVRGFFENINTKVDWSMTIFITYGLWNDKQWKSQFKNDKLTLIPIHTIAAPESTKASYYLHKLGWLGANYGSVLHHAIYVGILMGYKIIDIYGADHTFFDGLCVDENNRVCRKITHFYDQSSEIKPIYHTYTGEVKPYRMSYFVSEYEKVFLGHDILRFIADKENVRIINKTPISLIDSYERKDY